MSDPLSPAHEEPDAELAAGVWLVSRTVRVSTDWVMVGLWTGLLVVLAIIWLPFFL